MRFRFPALIAVFLVVPLPVHADKTNGDGLAENVIASFPISRDGGALLLPVKIDGKTYRFLVDTGATTSVFDSALPLGRQLHTMEAQAAGGDFVKVEVHAPPIATIGALPLECPRGVVALDFTTFREISGEDIYGLIGMDFLKKQIVQIDPDLGELRFLKKPGPNPAAHLNMACDKQKLPHLLFRIADFKDTAFMLDTGMGGFESGSLSVDVFAQLESSRELSIVGRGLSESLSGTHAHRIGRAKKLAFADLEVADPVFSESGGNKVGLMFLSRFVATLDFPGEKLYLKRGRRYGEADLWDLSGLHVFRKHGTVVVHSVDKDSIAAYAGLARNDSIVKCDDQDTAQMSLSDIRRRCCQTGTLTLNVVRLNEKKTVQLELKR